MDTDPGYELEAIEDERRDADMLQARYEEESNRFWSTLKQVQREIADGDLVSAATLCPHSGGYPLDSPAAEHAEDPHKGEEGYRCVDCGSRLDRSGFDGGEVTVPCEVPPSSAHAVNVDSVPGS